jgi:hypothetical protein
LRPGFQRPLEVIAQQQHNEGNSLMSVLSKEAHAALDRMDQLAALWRLISQLLAPEKDLSLIDRNGFATATDFLDTEYRQARDAFEAARQGMLVHDTVPS